MEMLRKITIKTVGFDAKTIKATVDEQDKAALIRVAGIVNAAKPGQTDKGEFLALIGEFSALNLQTGEQFSSGKCILPNFIADQFGAVLQQHGTAEFGLEIGAKKDDSAVTGYTFTVRPLVESKSSNRMQELIQTISAEAPALPAPSAKPSAAKKKARK